MLFQILIISFSVSVDALGIGISYKLKGVKITLLAKMLIGFISAGVMWASLWAGNMLLMIFPYGVAKAIGIFILAVIGISFIKSGLFGNENATYDFDHSKKIEFGEAVLLGIALSADSFSTGIAAATLGLGHGIMPITVGLMQIAFLYLGSILMDRSKRIQQMDKGICGVLSGCLLLLVAFLRVLN